MNFPIPPHTVFDLLQYFNVQRVNLCRLTVSFRNDMSTSHKCIIENYLFISKLLHFIAIIRVSEKCADGTNQNIADV
jgi:hypothetical protein